MAHESGKRCCSNLGHDVLCTQAAYNSDSLIIKDLVAIKTRIQMSSLIIWSHYKIFVVCQNNEPLKKVSGFGWQKLFSETTYQMPELFFIGFNIDWNDDKVPGDASFAQYMKKAMGDRVFGLDP